MQFRAKLQPSLGRVAGGAAARDIEDRSTGYFTATGEQRQVFVSAIKVDCFA